MIAKRSATVSIGIAAGGRGGAAQLLLGRCAGQSRSGYGLRRGFIEFALGVFKTEPPNIHQITKVLIEFISPTEAAVESYFTVQHEAGRRRQSQQDCSL